MGDLLNDLPRLNEELDSLKNTQFKNEKLSQIFAAIKNTESPFVDILSNGSRELVSYAMMLSNLCEHFKIKRGYENVDN